MELWTDGVKRKVIIFYFDSKLKKETLLFHVTVGFSSCVIQVNLLLELLVAAFAITFVPALFRKVDISWSHIELSILFTSEWVTNLHILTHSKVVPTLRVSTTNKYSSQMNAKRMFCFLYLKELSTEINTIPLHDSNLPIPKLEGYQNK